MRITRSLAASIVTIALASTVGAAGAAQPTPDNPHPYTTPPPTKERFAEQEKALQGQSRSSASGSPKVDKSAAAASPVPKATTKQQKKDRFNELESSYQQNSQSSASGSPKVDKSAAAANPVPKTRTKSEKKTQFTSQEKELQQQSKP
jgi:hypothetical protein